MTPETYIADLRERASRAPNKLSYIRGLIAFWERHRKAPPEGLKPLDVSYIISELRKDLLIDRDS